MAMWLPRRSWLDVMDRAFGLTFGVGLLPMTACRTVLFGGAAGEVGRLVVLSATVS